MVVAADEFLVVLQTQVDSYRKLLRLAELQHDHVQHGRTDELLDVLGKRQELLAQIGQAERILSPARREWAGYVEGLDAQQRRLAEALLAENRQLLERITSADRNDVLVLQQRKLNLGQQIDKAKSARQVNRAYATAAYGQNTGARMDVQR